ncbi:solute carrier family 35 member B1-like [Artemia franciscana]|uniref:Solute carrier family 35 member B1 n=1 Tax=Artemia franciscana TaxID=6661 RepID=A0AA88LCG8_ARTSF|nr:hypothetical protein QYM36_003420 [Artemia franciscana]
MYNEPKFFLYAVGIFTCYFFFGILQERITRGKYGEGESEEKFTYTLALVFFQCIINYLYAKIMLKFVFKQGEDTTRNVYYASSSMTYLLAMITSNMALQWVNYPTQVVGKSCKPIPVMVLGFLFGRKSYPIQKLMFVLIIVIGVAMFMFKDSEAAKSTEPAGLGMGELMLIISLTMDGLTGAVQERMKSEHQTRSGHMMSNMNLWSVGYLAVALLLTGEIVDFAEFVAKYPYVLWEMLVFSIASAFGQFFIFLMVTEYGPLPCSIVTTTRKFFTVLASVLFFGNSLLNRQWVGTILVFTGLTLDSIYGKSSVKKPE